MTTPPLHNPQMQQESQKMSLVTLPWVVPSGQSELLVVGGAAAW